MKQQYLFLILGLGLFAFACANTGGDADGDEDDEGPSGSGSQPSLPSSGGAESSGGSNTGGGLSGTGASVGTGGETQEPLGECDPYPWPTYEPDINYDFRDEFADINPDDFEVYLGCSPSLVAGYKTSGWFAFIWGHDRNPTITDQQIDRVLEELNADLGYAREVMGWPPDKLPQEGYFSNVYLYGSGLCTDNASNTALGGWQSGINGYPMVLISFSPVVTGDYGGITHEAIHAIMASMDGRKAHWFNEGGNTWLQMNMEAERTGTYGVGFLDGIPFLAPHQPIECYSGWLQDGTFGGPDAQGVNRNNAGGQQISTWRDYLGGSQYNSVFSHFLALYVSPGSNAWLWSNTNHINVLETLADGLGEEQTRRAILEYRARTALVDFGPWRNAFLGPVNSRWGQTVGAEEGPPGGILQEPTPHQLRPYVATTIEGNTLTPATNTLPGWSGANQIPLTVSGDEVRVSFTPMADNMRMQLVYRAEDGSAVYGQPVETGESCLKLEKPPKDGVVIAVVSNVDYIYEGEETRTKKHDYRLEMVSGVSETADITQKYF